MDRHRSIAVIARRTTLAAGVLLLGTLLVTPAAAGEARRAVDDGGVRVGVFEAGSGKHYKKRGKKRGHGKSDRAHRYDRGRYDDHDDHRYAKRRHRAHRDRHHYRPHRRDRRHGHVYDRHRHGGVHLRFEIPVRIRRGHHDRYDAWYDGRYWYDDHDHYHRVYRFPYRSHGRVFYRPYEYCDGHRYDRGSFSYSGSRFSIELDF